VTIPSPAAPVAVAPEASIYASCLPAVVAVGAVYDCGKCDNWHLGGFATGWIVSADGNVVLHQAVNMTAAGAAGGGMWGALIGLLFLNPLLGAAVGAGAGALSGKFTDIGINDQKMKDIGAALTAGGAAVCVLVREMTGDKVLAGLSDFHAKGRVVQTSLSDAQEAALRAAIDKPASA
jgi:uncharacterized membrane protein